MPMRHTEHAKKVTLRKLTKHTKAKKPTKRGLNHATKAHKPRRPH